VKVVGIGGAGCNAIRATAFDSVSVCTAMEDRIRRSNHQRVLLSPEEVEFCRDTPPRALRAVNFDLKDRISSAIGDNDLIYLFTGLGGDTGSHVSPLVADLCRKQSSLCISSVTLPFSVEGKDRQSMAATSLANIRKHSDITITYPNDHLLRMVPNLPLGKALSVMNEIMMVPLNELDMALTVNDLEPLRRRFSMVSYCRLGVGTGSGDRRALLAVDEASESPWFDFDRDRVRSSMVTISGSVVGGELVESVLRDLTHLLPYSQISYACVSRPQLEDRVRVMLLLGVS